jgi:hypothetical protein
MKILTYGVVVQGEPEPKAPFTADDAFEPRARRLKELVQAGFAQLDTFRSKQPAPSSTDGVVNADRPLYVLAAPEWLFRVRRSQFGAFDPNEYFAESHRQRYIELLTSLSARRAEDVLLVGGSILWIRPLDEKAREALGASTESYRKAKDAKYGTPEKARSEKRLEKEAAVFDARKAVVEGKVQKRFLGYNEAFAFFNGSQKKSVLKSWNAGDFDPFGAESADKHVEMVHGLGAGSFSLDIGGGKLKVAVAICFDHSRPLNYGKTVDLYILVSCSQDLSEKKKYVRGGGLILHSDCRGGGARAGDANASVVEDEADPFGLVRAVIDVGGA